MALLHTRFEGCPFDVYRPVSRGLDMMHVKIVLAATLNTLIAITGQNGQANFSPGCLFRGGSSLPSISGKGFQVRCLFRGSVR